MDPLINSTGGDVADPRALRDATYLVDRKPQYAHEPTPLNVLLVHIITVLKVHATAVMIERMVHTPNSEAPFSARLKAALDRAGFSGRGEGVRLARITKVTPKAASKWLNDEARPSHAKLVALAQALDVRAEWLQYGIGTMHPNDAEPEPLGVKKRAEELAPLATPRSQEALDHITQAAREGRLKEEDLLLLEQIANRIAAQPERPGDNEKNHAHERLRETLGNHDPSTEP